MTTRLLSTFVLAALGLCASGAALAAPILRSDVTVVSEIVTVGDMFDDAGALAEAALFRAPLPGTTGSVGIAAIRAAAHSVGLTEFGSDGIRQVRVGRVGTIVDEAMLTELIAADLAARGIVKGETVVQAAFDAADTVFNAGAVADPAQLLDLHYTPRSGAFTARFRIQGIERPVDLTGRIELLIEAPHLVATRPAGAVLGADDVEMRLTPLGHAEAGGVATLDQLVGKELRRQSRSGLLLRADDVAEPQTVKRNSLVTVVLRTGALTLTVKGQALNNAAAGQPVQVLNSVTKKILHGVATPDGAVEMTGTVSLAGL